MNWYYTINGQQAGPVSEAELTRLASTGAINGSTLVWREGMPDWQSLTVALPALSSASQGLPQIGGVNVPAAQKDIYVQQMREGVASTVFGTMRFAGFWIRFVAKFVDGMIMVSSAVKPSSTT